MVDSRAKGARGEYLVRDLLREQTKLKFERVPASGALEYLKGDLYVPNERNRFCIEVKNYADSPLSDKMFTQEKTNNLIRWWNKVVLQAKNGNQEPLLFFRVHGVKCKFVIAAYLPSNYRYYNIVRGVLLYRE